MTTRRDFLTGAAATAVALLTGASRARALGAMPMGAMPMGAMPMGAMPMGAMQQGGQRGMVHDSSLVRDSTNLFAMDQGAAQSVRLPPKPGATPLLTPLERDALERQIHCQCSCTLDVFTCRTTDFSCQVSPAMHRDVLALVDGGYSPKEILDAFVGVYGERARMAPTKTGFNLIAWFLPGVAIVVGGGSLAVLIRRWGRLSEARAASHGIIPLHVDATPAELAQLEAAVKGDDRE